MRLSHNCQVEIIPGRYCEWNFVSDVPSERQKARPFDVVDVPKQRGTYIRPTRPEEVAFVPGGQIQDRHVLVEALVSGRPTVILVPRDLVKR
jgi:hypothetical protein